MANTPESQQIDTVASTNNEKVQPKEQIKLPKGVTNFGITLVTIIVTALVTWYVNFRLSHLTPVVAITNVEFVYDLERVTDIIEIPQELVNKDRIGFFGANIQSSYCRIAS